MHSNIVSELDNYSNSLVFAQQKYSAYITNIANLTDSVTSFSLGKPL